LLSYNYLNILTKPYIVNILSDISNYFNDLLIDSDYANDLIWNDEFYGELYKVDFNYNILIVDEWVNKFLIYKNT
jgi:hypothetical protein